jgi:hypothetical protein
LKAFRRFKGYRYGLYYQCEELIAFRRLDDSESGIICNGFDVNIKVLFKSEENLYKFQNALHGYTRNNKSLADGIRQLSPTLEREDVSPLPIQSNCVARIMVEDYVQEDQDTSPPFSINENVSTSPSSTSRQSQHPQNPKTNPDITLQMIERLDSVMFIGQIAERCHLHPNVADSSNFLYLSRYFHQQLDGIDCLDIKVPTLLIHYVSHNMEPEQSPVPSIIAYRTKIQIFFRYEDDFNTIVQLLKQGGTVKDISHKRAYEMDLYFRNANVARECLNYKESATIQKWREAGDDSFSFLLN